MMWLKHGKERAHTKGIKVHWQNIAPVHIYILVIEKSQWRLAMTPNASPHGKQCVSMLMLLFCTFSVLRFLSLDSRAFHTSADRVAWGMTGRACPALLKLHSGVGFDSPPPFCWSCCMAYFAVLWWSSSWLWVRLFTREILALVMAGSEAVGLRGGCPWQVAATATAISLVLPEQNIETHKKMQMERCSREHQSLPFPQGRIICICHFQQKFV